MKYKSSIQSWGPAGWTFLYTIAITYPMNPTPKEKYIFQQFFYYTGQTLPCPECRYHYIRFWNLQVPDFSSVTSLCRWLHRLHNDVNGRLGKKYVTFEEMLAMYVPPGLLKSKFNLEMIDLEAYTEALTRRHRYIKTCIVCTIIVLGVCLFGLLLFLR